MKNQRGFSLIELLIVVVILAIAATLAVPNLLASRRAANEGSALSSLRTIGGAQHTYMTSIGAGEYGTLADLANAEILDDSFNGSVPRSGFNFTTNVIPRSPTSFAGYDCFATPTNNTGPLATASRRFYINEMGAIYTAPAATVISADSVTRVITGGTPLSN